MVLPALYPMVELVVQPGKLARGSFATGFPRGATIHYSADRNLDSMRKADLQSGYSYHLVLDRAGKVTQTCYLDQKTWHAGRANWNGVSPNSGHVAICLLSWGQVTPGSAGDYLSWCGTVVPAADVAARPDNLSGNISYWDIATPEQEACLEKVCLWLMANGIMATELAGHDEVAIPKGRKTDPGGILSRTMPDFRKYLAQQFTQGGTNQ